MTEETILNSKTLVILTGSFPYGFGETFLEAEIAIISKYFEKIIILPEKKNERIRRVPENVEIIQITFQESKWSEVIFSLFKYRSILKEFVANSITRPGRNKVLLMNLKWALSRKKAVEKSFPDLSSNHVFYSYWADHSALSLCLLETDNIRLTRVHGWDAYEERHKYEYLPFRKFLLKKLDAIFSISEHAKNYLENKYGYKSKIAVSRLGVRAEKNLDLDAGRFNHMISMSNAVPLKRVGRIAKAFNLFRESEIKWSHYGSGELLDDLVAKYGREYFKGQLSNAQMLDELNELKREAFLINLSEYEGIPVSMMEAMSFGIPCIGTNVGGVGEIIENGVNGILLSANPSEDEVKQAIQRLLSMDSEEIKTMRQNARRTWERKFNAETNFKNFAEQLQSLQVHLWGH